VRKICEKGRFTYNVFSGTLNPTQSMSFVSPNQQCLSVEGNSMVEILSLYISSDFALAESKKI